MTKTASLTDKAVSVLRQIAKMARPTRDTVASKLGVSPATVNGSLTALKRHGLVEQNDDGHLKATPDAAEFIGKRATKGAAASTEPSKMDQARAIFNKNINKGRAAVLAAFQSDAQLTPKGASTYFQTLRTEAEAAGVAFHRGMPVEKVRGAKKTLVKRKAA